MLRQTTQRGIDLKLFGAMFLLVGLIDMLIIEGFPAYALKLFGVTIAGPLAYLVKLHSPAAHFLIGYGFRGKQGLITRSKGTLLLACYVAYTAYLVSKVFVAPA